MPIRENCLAVHMVYDQSEDQIKDDVYTVVRYRLHR